MSIDKEMSVLILPGLYGSGPEHWQTRWERTNASFRRVEQRDWDTPCCSDWVAELDKAVSETGPDVILVAHSLGCLLVANWSARIPERRIKGALLVAPPAGYPPGSSGFLPVPLNKLPYPSILVASQNDEYATIEEARRFADAWGSRFVDIGMAGHINSDSGLGDWPEGITFLEELRMTALL